MYLEYVICILGVIACSLILLKNIKNYKLLNDRYNELQVSICLSNCQNGLFKTEDFFYMKNGGVNPCDALDSIEYVDYIENCNIFVERK